MTEWGKYKKGLDYGFLYVLTNESMQGLVKIGQTARHPATRVLELSDHSGVPLPFKVYFYIEVTDRVKAEQVVHEFLSEKRLSPNREFFSLSPEEAVNGITSVANDFISASAARTPAGSDKENKRVDMPVFLKGVVCPNCGGRVHIDTENSNFERCFECQMITKMN